MSLLEAARSCESDTHTAWIRVAAFSFCAGAALGIRTPLTHRLHLLWSGGWGASQNQGETVHAGGGSGAQVPLLIYFYLLGSHLRV